MCLPYSYRKKLRVESTLPSLAFRGPKTPIISLHRVLPLAVIEIHCPGPRKNKKQGRGSWLPGEPASCLATTPCEPSSGLRSGRGTRRGTRGHDESRLGRCRRSDVYRSGSTKRVHSQLDPGDNGPLVSAPLPTDVVFTVGIVFGVGHFPNENMEKGWKQVDHLCPLIGSNLQPSTSSRFRTWSVPLSGGCTTDRVGAGCGET